MTLYVWLVSQCRATVGTAQSWSYPFIKDYVEEVHGAFWNKPHRPHQVHVALWQDWTHD